MCVSVRWLVDQRTRNYCAHDIEIKILVDKQSKHDATMIRLFAQVSANATPDRDVPRAEVGCRADLSIQQQHRKSNDRRL